jgi:signal transduction histidine kinase
MKEFAHPGREDKVPADLNKIIETTLTVARNEWKYVADLVTDFDCSLPEVLCHPGEINQVILNLVVNAAHAIEDHVKLGRMPKGVITVATRRKDAWAEIQISDTGGGIPEAIRPRIFDPFFTTKEPGRGTGQGLAICHPVIVDKHGGRIFFESEMGRGTTFTINLPLNQQAV